MSTAPKPPWATVMVVAVNSAFAAILCSHLHPAVAAAVGAAFGLGSFAGGVLFATTKIPDGVPATGWLADAVGGLATAAGVEADICVVKNLDGPAIAVPQLTKRAKVLLDSRWVQLTPPPTVLGAAAHEIAHLRRRSHTRIAATALGFLTMFMAGGAAAAAEGLEPLFVAGVAVPATLGAEALAAAQRRREEQACDELAVTIGGALAAEGLYADLVERGAKQTARVNCWSSHPSEEHRAQHVARRSAELGVDLTVAEPREKMSVLIVARRDRTDETLVEGLTTGPHHALPVILDGPTAIQRAYALADLWARGPWAKRRHLEITVIVGPGEAVAHSGPWVVIEADSTQLPAVLAEM